MSIVSQSAPPQASPERIPLGALLADYRLAPATRARIIEEASRGRESYTDFLFVQRNRRANRTADDDSWTCYRLAHPTYNGEGGDYYSVVNPTGVLYAAVVDTRTGLVRYPDCPDQAFCDAVNAVGLELYGIAPMVATKHAATAQRLRELLRYGASAFTGREVAL